MIKKFLLWVLREELDDLYRLSNQELSDHREWIVQSLAQSFATVNKRIEAVETLALNTSDGLDRVNVELSGQIVAVNEEVDLLSGALCHLEDTVVAQAELEDSVFEDFTNTFEDIYCAIDLIADELDMGE